MTRKGACTTGPKDAGAPSQLGVCEAIGGSGLLLAIGISVFGGGVACTELQTCDADAAPSTDWHLRRPVDPDVLSRAFDVREFSLIHDEDANLYRFTVPPRAAFVTCGLFVGAPKIDTERQRIENAGSIMPRVRAFDANGGDDLAISIGSLRVVGSGGDASPFRCSSVPEAPYVVEGLWLGCWSSAGAAVNGATELVQLDIEDVPQAQPPVAGCFAEDLSRTANRLCRGEAELGTCGAMGCEEGTPDAAFDDVFDDCRPTSQGKACVLNASAQFGRCRGGFCDASEEFPADQLVMGECSVESQDADAGPSESLTDGFSCQQVELGEFGTCYAGRCHRRCDANAEDSCNPEGASFSGLLATETACRQPDGLPTSVCVAEDER